MVRDLVGNGKLFFIVIANKLSRSAPPTILSALIISGTFLCWSAAVCGQNKCLTSDEVKTIVAKINSPKPATPNKKLAGELLKLRAENQKAFLGALEENLKEDAFKKRIGLTKEKTTPLFCGILKEFGWPTANLVGKDGAAAAFYLLRNNAAFSLQVEMLPVMVAAVEKEEIAKPEFAALIDRIRVDAGVKQLFGTQASVSTGLLILFPIEGEARVDERRKQYGLPPLADQMRSMEATYHLPLVRAPVTMVNAYANSLKRSVEKSTAASALGMTPGDDDEVVRVETNLASVNVSVYSSKSRLYIGTLQKNDFRVFEDGQEESVSFFATTDLPFDLVLLIDVSGSTAKKLDLVRKSTKRFIEAARPADRLAIVTFSNTVKVISPLTADRALLRESVRKIESEGGSNVWDAVRFSLAQVVGPRSTQRRSAIVLMSDGVDNSLALYDSPRSRFRGSTISFADLLEAVRKSDTMVIPIYLDTEYDSRQSGFDVRMYENARRTLALLADESGGLYYKAKRIEDLNGVYEQVIDDLGKVYSLGYKPTNEKRDGSWRALKIQIPDHPELITRTRPGYYAN